jgi:hypothetical protein
MNTAERAEIQPYEINQMEYLATSEQPHPLQATEDEKKPEEVAKDDDTENKTKTKTPKWY